MINHPFVASYMYAELPSGVGGVVAVPVPALTVAVLTVVELPTGQFGI